MVTLRVSVGTGHSSLATGKRPSDPECALCIEISSCDIVAGTCCWRSFLKQVKNDSVGLTIYTECRVRLSPHILNHHPLVQRSLGVKDLIRAKGKVQCNCICRRSL